MALSNIIPLAAVVFLSLLVPVILQRCPSGPTRRNQYDIASQRFLCASTCEVRVGLYGSTLQSRPRTIYRCCIGSAYRNGIYYSCLNPLHIIATASARAGATSSAPPSSSPSTIVGAQTSGTSSTQPPSASTPTKPISTEVLAKPTFSTTRSSKAPNTAKPTFSTTQPSTPNTAKPTFSTTQPSTPNTAKPTFSNTKAPNTASPQNIRSCPSGPTRASQFPGLRNVCRFKCYFRVSIYRRVQLRSRMVYSCCEGYKPQIISLGARTYSCVQNI